MTPLLLVAAGVLAVVGGVAVLQTFGSRYRVGRLLATTPLVDLAEALSIAAGGRPRYVRIDGRIDADDEFEDINHRPLVFRRTRLEAHRPGRWVTFEDSRETAPFEIRDGALTIAIDGDAIDTGLVVVPRESVGAAADLADRAPSDMLPETRVRATVEQLSSVDHATALGVPKQGTAPGDPPRLTAGLGRPLILTNLAPDEAMRVLAQGSTRPRIAAACFVVGGVLVVAGLAWAGLGAIAATFVGDAVPIALGASPSPPAAGGDPRSSGEGPGLVGQPFLALLAVIAIALVAVIVTTAYVRLTARPDKPTPRQR
ncbi:MAG TPA: hypothetical protein VK697_05375 [Methylomirabilota bacterium]|nr:hypothetical protein [Methylomirabilota bacterium]